MGFTDALMGVKNIRLISSSWDGNATETNDRMYKVLEGSQHDILVVPMVTTLTVALDSLLSWSLEIFGDFEDLYLPKINENQINCAANLYNWNRPRCKLQNRRLSRIAK